MSKRFPEKEDPMMMLIEAMMGGNPSDSIVRSEKRGQSDLVRSEVLPKKCNFCERSQLEKMGIVFGEDADDIFVFATLPAGWKKVATDHDMWSKLVDEKGRERASIFYKAAFYDRDAHISINSRYYYTVQPVNGWDHSDEGSYWQAKVLDVDGTVLWLGESVGPQPSYKDHDALMSFYKEKDLAMHKAKDWVDEHFPQHKDPLAYWD